MTDNMAAELLRKLDVLIALTSISALERKTQREQIEVLNRAGLAPKDIARFIGTTPNTVSVTLSKTRPGPKRQARRKREE